MVLQMTFEADNEEFRKNFGREARKIPKSVIDKAVRESEKFIKAELVSRTPVGIKSTPSQGRGPGNLRVGWSDLKKVSGGFAFDNPVEYSEVVEGGGYVGLGPRTVEQGGQIYSSQAPGGIVQPLITNEVFINQLSDRLAKSIDKHMKKVFRKKGK